MSELINVTRRNFLRVTGGLAVTAAAPLVFPTPMIISPAEARSACGGDRRVVNNVRWQRPGRDPFSRSHKDAPRAIRALQSLTAEEQKYFLKAVEPFADIGWAPHRDTADFIRPIVQNDEWAEMVNGCTHFRWVRDEPNTWERDAPRRQFAITLTDAYTGYRVEVSLPDCVNARARRGKKGQVPCIGFPDKTEFNRKAQIV